MNVGDTFTYWGDEVTVTKVTQHSDCGYRYRKVFFQYADGRGSSFIFVQGWES